MTAQSPNAEAIPNLTPLTLERDGNHLRFSLRSQEDIMAQLPPDYEHQLADRLADILAEQVSLSAEVDLEEVAGVSSRQLGSLIALGKVLRPRFGTIRVRNVSPGVKRLFTMTRTDQLFELG